MNANINTLTIAAIKAAESFNDRVVALRAALPKPVLRDAAKVADALRGGVAQHYGVELEIKGTGRAVFPSAHKATPAAKQTLKRLVKAVMGESNNRKETEAIEVPAHIAKLAAQLAKACAEYEGARKLASTAVAQAFAE